MTTVRSFDYKKHLKVNPIKLIIITLIWNKRINLGGGISKSPQLFRWQRAWSIARNIGKSRSGNTVEAINMVYDLIGDIDSALDCIIAQQESILFMQNALIGGETE